MNVTIRMSRILENSLCISTQIYDRYTPAYLDKQGLDKDAVQIITGDVFEKRQAVRMRS